MKSYLLTSSVCFFIMPSNASFMDAPMPMSRQLKAIIAMVTATLALSSAMLRMISFEYRLPPPLDSFLFLLFFHLLYIFYLCICLLRSYMHVLLLFLIHYFLETSVSYPLGFLLCHLQVSSHISLIPRSAFQPSSRSAFAGFE